MPESVIEKIRKLEQEKRQLLDAAKNEALVKVNDAIDALRELGFNYRLVEGNATRTAPSGERSAARRPKTGVPCPICGFATEPPHDKRSHRSHSQPFSDQELAQKGWRRFR